jgi:uncharacterized cupin superfamily protein
MDSSKGLARHRSFAAVNLGFWMAGFQSPNRKTCGPTMILGLLMIQPTQACVQVLDDGGMAFNRASCTQVRSSPQPMPKGGGKTAAVYVRISLDRTGEAASAREVALVLEDSVRIEFKDGSSVELGPGDLLSIAPGIEMTWHITTPFKEAWVLAG